MKNKISMALKDPTLQQGFEIICKENAELAEHLGKANDKIADLEETINKLREQLALRYDLEDKIKELEAQIEKMKSDVISARDEALRVEDIITYEVLNTLLPNGEIKEK